MKETSSLSLPAIRWIEEIKSYIGAAYYKTNAILCIGVSNASDTLQIWQEEEPPRAISAS